MEQNKIELIKKLHEEGKKNVEIATQLKINRSTVSYHLSDDFKKKRLRQSVEWFKKLPLERRKAIYKKRSPYMTKYHRERYKNDEVFRNKQLTRMKVKVLKGGLKNDKK
jgi:DNA-binding transcriptional ArsR family regulator